MAPRRSSPYPPEEASWCGGGPKEEEEAATPPPSPLTPTKTDDDDDDDASSPLLPPPPARSARRDDRRCRADERPRDSDDDCGVDDAKRRRPRTRRFTLRYHASLILRKAPELLHFLLHGTPRWLFKFVRLVLFVAALLPAFIRFGWYYWIAADRVAASYKPNGRGTSRHFADVYGSRTPSPPRSRREGNGAGPRGEGSSDEEREERGCGSGGEGEEGGGGGKPVVIFLTGGAWIIGYKMWGALLARALAPLGALVIIPDYRNFPGSRVEGMVRDADDSIQWTLDRCRQYGGDPDRVVLVGQSAGAHLGSCVVAVKCLLELDPPSRSQYPLTTSYSPSSLRGFIPVSGPYDLVAMRRTFHEHGLDENLVGAIFGNEVEKWSPAHIAERCRRARERTEGKGGGGNGEATTMGEILPPVRLIHGTADRTVPYRECTNFASLLRSACGPPAAAAAAPSRGGDRKVATFLYDGWSHTDPILEGPMDGDQRLHREIYDAVREWTGGDGLAEEFDEGRDVCRPMCPRALIWLGRRFNPF